ncbi:hypothetical protein [Saccharomonospora saliphila]|uniref:hypothetical protein n=1 Tax=Saccharomonospora saliphila TaxID=369829 RepID=UPI00039C667E|nr:hypothetical protein [Saccharomonospora saliphila]
MRDAVEHVLDTAGRPPADGRNGTVALLRGFDRDSRELRDATRAVARRHGWSLVDLPMVPRVGRMPVADDVQLVVVARPSLRRLAERCAAYWRASVLEPEAVTADPWHWSHRAATAVDLITPEGGRDSIASRLDLSGSLAYGVSGSARTAATELSVEVSDSGVVVRYAGEAGRGLRYPRGGSLTITLDEPARGTLDGDPHLFAPGRYQLTRRRRAFDRIVVETV